MERETYFRPAPPTTREPQDGVAVGVETITPACIEEIVINDAARSLLPESLRHLATPDFLKGLIHISVPTQGSSSRVLTPDDWCRTVPLGYGVIPFEHAVGRVVSGKGAWLSGSLLDERKNLVLNVNVRDTFYGLLSTSGAAEDTELSNEFIKAGFRSALHLGYAIFREKPFKEWIFQHWRQTDFGDIIERIFTILAKSNYGRPAYLFRVGATLERHTNSWWGRKPLGRLRKETSIAARLMLAETRMPRSQIAHTFAKIGEQQKQALSALHTLGLGQSLPEDEATGYAHLLAALYARNAVALNQVRWKGGIPKGGRLSKGKDVDLGHFSYDFDESIKDPTGTRLTNITLSVLEYTHTAAETLADYFTKILMECGYVDKYSRLSLGKERVKLDYSMALNYSFIALLKHYAGYGEGR